MGKIIAILQYDNQTVDLWPVYFTLLGSRATRQSTFFLPPESLTECCWSVLLTKSEDTFARVSLKSTKNWSCVLFELYYFVLHFASISVLLWVQLHLKGLFFFSSWCLHKATSANIQQVVTEFSCTTPDVMTLISTAVHPHNTYRSLKRQYKFLLYECYNLF